METGTNTFRYGRLHFHTLADVVHDFFAPFIREDPDGETWMDMPFSLVTDISMVATDLDLVPFRYPEDILRKQIRNLSSQIMLHWREDLLPPVVSSEDIATILLDNAVMWEEFDKKVSLYVFEELPESIRDAYRRRYENA